MKIGVIATVVFFFKQTSCYKPRVRKEIGCKRRVGTESEQDDFLCPAVKVIMKMRPCRCKLNTILSKICFLV
jgi:hypothetical protein